MIVATKKQADFKSVDLLRFGNDLLVAGVLYSNGREDYLIRVPGESSEPEVVELVTNDAQWEVLLRQVDLMETEILAKDGGGRIVKSIVRKSARQIDQQVSWRVFKRDNYTCRYCSNDNCPLTIDHLVTWEVGGPTIEANLLSACKRCNKLRGNTTYEEWIKSRDYASVSKKLPGTVRADNEALIPTLANIPLKYHVTSR